MDARLYTLNDELCQVNTYVGCIARQQAHLGGFVESLTPSPETLRIWTMMVALMAMVIGMMVLALPVMMR